MTTSLRLGIVEYANVAPLVAGLDGTARVRRAVPARVADWLATGEVDLALVPAIEAARMPGVRVIPGLGVAADGPCDSVLLFTRGALASIRTCALDASSRTSNGLTRILLDREGASGVRWLRLGDGSLEERLAQADAALLIGDPALRATTPEGVARFDLSAEWKRHVGLPFVFAVWATRPGFEPDRALRDALVAAADRGLASLPQLAEREAARTGIDRAVMLRYLSKLQYRLADEHLMGLRAFFDEAWRVGLLPHRAQAEFWP